MCHFIYYFVFKKNREESSCGCVIVFRSLFQPFHETTFCIEVHGECVHS